MAGQVVGEAIEHAVDLGLVGEIRGRRAEPPEPGRALAVVGQEAMHVAAADPPVGRDGAVRAAVVEAQQRTRAGRGPEVSPICIS